MNISGIEPLDDRFGLESWAIVRDRKFHDAARAVLAKRATEGAFTAIEDTVNEYLDHWFGLVGKGVSAESVEGISSEQLVERDRRNKAIIFNEDVDKVWDQITPLIGREAVDAQIALLRQTSEGE